MINQKNHHHHNHNNNDKKKKREITVSLRVYCFTNNDDTETTQIQRVF